MEMAFYQRPRLSRWGVEGGWLVKSVPAEGIACAKVQRLGSWAVPVVEVWRWGQGTEGQGASRGDGGPWCLSHPDELNSFQVMVTD